MRRDIAERFELDPALTHLNHGAFGAVPRSVREAQDRARARIERAPMRAFRDELAAALAGAREQAAAFLGLPTDSTALVRNVTEGVGVVLQGLGIGPGDDVVVSNHGYLTAGWSAEARGATLRRAEFPVDADPGKVAAAFAAAVTDRTRLVIVDQITSPTALLLPVAEVAAAVAPVPVLVDAAHVPGALPGLDVEDLGVAFWAG
ncbi:MAG: aminotransferase class V-fold PLP-dependent enzyme, partial [Dermatophilaceae bacterium]|nr:aminotransferase class V-fold PLP-dependent enzyme [Dermatophilaceae bacterium]